MILGQRKRNKDRKRKSAPDPRNDYCRNRITYFVLHFCCCRSGPETYFVRPNQNSNIYIYIFIYIKRERQRGRRGFLLENAMMMASMLLLHSTYLKAQQRRRQSIDKRFACSWCCCCCQSGSRGEGGYLLDWATRCIINQTELSKTSETVLFPIGKQVGEELTIPFTPFSPTRSPWPMTSADGPATVQVATAALTSRKHVDRRLQCTPAKDANGLSAALSASLFHSPTIC